MSGLSVKEYIEQQLQLEDEARVAMPWDPNSCTYVIGALRQQVFACRSHDSIGICYSCSIQCHTSCDIVELFTKRSFTCDCGTERDPKGMSDNYRCQLRKNNEADIPSSDNTYGHNFKGLFCSCEKEYNPDSDAVMLQCVMGTECNEDWYHDHCIMDLKKYQLERIKQTTGNGIEETSETVPKGFPALESFDAYICWKCVSKNDHYFRRLLSHPLSNELIAYKLNRGSSLPQSNTDSKKRTIHELTVTEDDSSDYSIFLKENYSEVLKNIHESLKTDTDTNNKLFKFIDYTIPFLMIDEPVYEQPEYVESDSGKYELGTESFIKTLQHDVAIEGIVALQALKSKLGGFFKTFAEKGDIVKEKDIEEFFSQIDDKEWK